MRIVKGMLAGLALVALVGCQTVKTGVHRYFVPENMEGKPLAVQALYFAGPGH